ncbi:MAG: FAD/NAD(P)-binding protein [Alphaproteobacteria bacterium]|nr:FAD/NAD(P)-binding protein [Alphaproteobacteria bacterium]MBU1525094.1 FAD/NAD(P)-binding protein [Alphaproteobacteria bacterium]MBU2116413.1 FAD/NAD(P)-binding protein [Alphaproteobacteria bacterium]MBU2351320.1 FAD/NAD(P)-binding protein [Alphaproteobacteria bacterium]MBU2381485.1 FAD/NAD(P)-binding protein [Alphaproteobacteria bacterium]
MLAARLAERGRASVLIDATGRFGRGVAYSTDFDGHLLNVRAARMSAVEGRPDDFVTWLRARAPAQADPQAFAPRGLYGRYVQDRLAAVEAAHPGLIKKVHARVAAIDGTDVRLDDGRRLAGRSVVLATGNPAPKTAGEPLARVIRDPWAPGALAAVGPGETLAVIGTGLTMVDVALALEARGWAGKMQAFSLRGLLPRAHGETPDAAVTPTPEMLDGPAARRLGAGRRLARDHDWRGVMEGLRPVTGDLWRATDASTRSRLFRHLRPWWDVHRHRIAPGVAARIDRMIADGRLTVSAARVTGVRAVGPDAIDRDGVVVACLPPRATTPRDLVVDRVIDCSGPGHDPTRDPLTAPLLASGRARLEPLGVGLDLDDAGRVVGADGAPDPVLFVLGPPARAVFWESIAVPDIRRRIEDVVAALP